MYRCGKKADKMQGGKQRQRSDCHCAKILLESRSPQDSGQVIAAAVYLLMLKLLRRFPADGLTSSQIVTGSAG